MLFVFSFVCMVLVIVCKDKEKKITPSLRAARIGCFCKKKFTTVVNRNLKTKKKITYLARATY